MKATSSSHLTRLPSPQSPALEVCGLSVAYRGRAVLDDVSFAVPRGRRVAVIGPNGAGKSSLLKAMLGIVPARGDVRLLGLSLERARKHVAYVPQRESVDFDYPVTALDVVLMGLYREIGWLRRIRGEHRRRALEALAEVGLADRADATLGQLSGGQQQRVFLARALAGRPDLFLLDEALAGVDAATEDRFFATFDDLQQQGKTVVMVHHDLLTVAERFDHVIVVGGQRVICGPAHEILPGRALEDAYGGRTLHLDPNRLNRCIQRAQRHLAQA